MSYSTLLVFVAQGGTGYSAGDSTSMYTATWTITGGSYSILAPGVSRHGKYMMVIKITPSSDTVSMYCNATTGSTGYRKFYVIGV